MTLSQRRAVRFFSSFILSAILAFLANGAHAKEPYQEVVSGQYSRDDGDQNSRTISYGLQGRVYFSPVKTDGHPYGEAAFLERIGSVYVRVEEDEFKETGREGDGPLFGAGINAVKPGVPYAVEAFYIRSTRDYDPPSTLEVTGYAYGTKVGYFFTDTCLIGLQYVYNTWDNEWAGFPEVIGRQQVYGLFMKYDRDLGQNRLVSPQATLGRHTDSVQTDRWRNIEESILVDYYFTRSLSAGVGLRNSSGTKEEWEGKTYSANIVYYLTPRLSVKAGVERFLNANNGQENSKSYDTVVAARF